MTTTNTMTATKTMTVRRLRRDDDTRDYDDVYALTWQGCHDELARPDIDPAWRAQVELRLENIRRGSC
ncbi:MAG: hypothetical protein LC769_06235 [Chloroflexi bacterium]|nr:hypothetical protein [Chloroflexota bacterium]